MRNDSIPYWLYLIIGPVIVLFSLIVNFSLEDNKMTLFIVVGCVFTVVGFGKLLVGKSVSKNKHRIKIPTYEPVHKKYVAKYRRPEKNIQLSDVRCPNCNAKIHPKFRYCPGCGTRLK